LNSIKFAALISSITRTLSHDMTRLLAFLNKVLGNREKLGPEASMCLDMEVAMVHTEMGELSTAKAMLETAKESLHTIKSSESYVFSKFYKATFVYRKVAGPANEFYNASLMFLAYTSVDDLRPTEKIALATDMALAAITGDDIYNFGEVLATPILKALKNTPSEWLLLLVEAMNNGHVDHFNSVLASYHSLYTTQPVLQHKHDKVIEKMRLLAVLQLAFERPSHSRVIAFEDISNRIKVSTSEVVEQQLMQMHVVIYIYCLCVTLYILFLCLSYSISVQFTYFLCLLLLSFLLLLLLLLASLFVSTIHTYCR